jgi:hypothetical protein
MWNPIGLGHGHLEPPLQDCVTVHLAKRATAGLWSMVAARQTFSRASRTNAPPSHPTSKRQFFDVRAILPRKNLELGHREVGS